jgi:hypothetical protein
MRGWGEGVEESETDGGGGVQNCGENNAAIFLFEKINS